MYNDTKKAMDLRKVCYGTDITEEGYRERDGHWYINYSSILTTLIQNTGRFCERFASDLFIDWSTIDSKLQDGSMETGSYFFGLRDSGVDHESFIDSRMSSYGFSSYQYRKIFRLDVVTTEDPSWEDTISLHLYEVD